MYTYNDDINGLDYDIPTEEEMHGAKKGISWDEYYEQLNKQCSNCKTDYQKCPNWKIGTFPCINKSNC